MHGTDTAQMSFGDLEPTRAISMSITCMSEEPVSMGSRLDTYYNVNDCTSSLDVIAKATPCCTCGSIPCARRSKSNCLLTSIGICYSRMLCEFSEAMMKRLEDACIFQSSKCSNFLTISYTDFKCKISYTGQTSGWRHFGYYYCWLYHKYVDSPFVL